MNKILLTFVLSLSFYTSAKGQTKNFIDQPYIEVSGYADTLVTPNMIFIKIIIAEKDSRDKIAVEEQENKMIIALKNLGLNTENDLSASDMLSNYKFHLLRQKDILKTKEYILKVTNADMVSKVFLQLEELGISNTTIHKVEHSDLENIKNICKIKAVENSHKRAVAMTKIISQTIGNAIHISDNDTDDNNHFSDSFTRFEVRSYDRLGNAPIEAPKIEFEKIKINASVNVKYLLK